MTWYRDPVERALALSTVAAALATGVFYTVSALYFTRVIGLSATTVGIGLTIGGAVGVAASFAAGPASDRWGADRLLVWGTVVHGAALMSYVLARDVAGFVLVACVAVGARGAHGTARAALIARWFTGPDRVAVRARLRVATNVFIGLGTLLAGAALLVGTAEAYRWAMVATGVLTILGTVPLLRLRRRVPEVSARTRRAAHGADGLPRAAPGRSPLRDRTYLATTALGAVMVLNFSLTSVGVPLWVAVGTEAPEAVISLLLALNTLVVALTQVRATRGTESVAGSGRAVRRGGAALAVSCLVYAAAGYAGPVVAVAFLVVAKLALSAGEVWSEAGGWGLSFELADPDNAGAYQGVAQAGRSVGMMLAPLVVTATAIDHGLAGWLALGGSFAAAGVLAAAVAARAASRTAEGEPVPAS